MSKILVAYTTNAGSTTKVAEVIGQTLGQDGTQVDVRRLDEVDDLSDYQAVLIGGPMILGWHRSAQAFVKKHRQALSQVGVAYFMTAMSLTHYDGEKLGSTPVYQDARLAKPPQTPGKLSFKEKFTTVESYLGPVMKQTPQVKPVSVGIFGGKLDYGKLNIFQMLFVMLVIAATPGDFRNWDAIRAWAEQIRPALLA